MELKKKKKKGKGGEKERKKIQNEDPFLKELTFSWGEIKKQNKTNEYAMCEKNKCYEKIVKKLESDGGRCIWKASSIR